MAIVAVSTAMTEMMAMLATADGVGGRGKNTSELNIGNTLPIPDPSPKTTMLTTMMAVTATARDKLLHTPVLCIKASEDGDHEVQSVRLEPCFRHAISSHKVLSMTAFCVTEWRGKKAAPT